MFPRNCWYVAAFGADLTVAPLARTICDQAVVLFRAGDGRAFALEDRCIHRGMPLSQGGEVAGDIIRCPYHGLEFDGTGTCRKIPGQDQVPAGARIAAFPLVEQDRRRGEGRSRRDSGACPSPRSALGMGTDLSRGELRLAAAQR